MSTNMKEVIKEEDWEEEFNLRFNYDDTVRPRRDFNNFYRLGDAEIEELRSFIKRTLHSHSQELIERIEKLPRQAGASLNGDTVSVNLSEVLEILK